MTYMPIPDEIVEALNEGKTVELTHANLGPAGYNGTITLDPEEYNDPYGLEPRFEVVE